MNKTYSLIELEKIRKKGSEVCHCYKTRNDTCTLKSAEMYDHDGGDYVEGKEGKQWIYFGCQRCNYDWSIWKIEQRIENVKVN